MAVRRSSKRWTRVSVTASASKGMRVACGASSGPSSGILTAIWRGAPALLVYAPTTRPWMVCEQTHFCVCGVSMVVASVGAQVTRSPHTTPQRAGRGWSSRELYAWNRIWTLAIPTIYAKRVMCLPGASPWSLRSLIVPREHRDGRRSGHRARGRGRRGCGTLLVQLAQPCTEHANAGR